MFLGESRERLAQKTTFKKDILCSINRTFFFLRGKMKNNHLIINNIINYIEKCSFLSNKNDNKIYHIYFYRRKNSTFYLFLVKIKFKYPVYMDFILNY